MNGVGNKLKIFRMKKGLTIKALADLSKLSAGYICHLEKGTRKNPSIEMMDKIAIALNKSVSEVFFNG